jgi:NH3-dependent NAD+ synthetase
MWGMLYQRQDLLPQALAEYGKEFEITGDELARLRAESVETLIQSRSAGRSLTNQPATGIGIR